MSQAAQNNSDLFGEAVEAAVREKLTSGYIREKVDEKLDRILERLIDNQLSFGGVHDTIKKSMEDALKVDRLDLPSFSWVVKETLEQRINQIVPEFVAARLEKDVSNLLKLAPKEVLLSDIIKRYVEDEVDPEERSYGDIVDLDISQSDYGSIFAAFGPSGEYNPNKYGPKRWQLPYQLHLSPVRDEDGKQPDLEDGDVRCSLISADMKGSDTKTSTHIGIACGFDDYLRSLYMCGTIITVDQYEADAACSRGD